MLTDPCFSLNLPQTPPAKRLTPLIRDNLIPSLRHPQEIVSGAQRIHDLTLLVERAKAKGIPVETIASYLAAFKHGAEPHGEHAADTTHLLLCRVQDVFQFISLGGQATGKVCACACPARRLTAAVVVLCWFDAGAGGSAYFITSLASVGRTYEHAPF